MFKFSILLLLLPLLPAHAGYGAIPTVCTAYESTPLIFRARVLQFNGALPFTADLPAPEWGVNVYPNYPGSSRNSGSSEGPIDYIRLQVLEVFKGDPGPEVTIIGRNQIFSKGGGFLVYAEPTAQKQVVAPILTRTGPLEYPQTADDLAWLRAYPTAPPTASIFGSINMGHGITDIPPISITVAGSAITRTASSAADHTYSFKDLPPGAYTVTAVLPVGYTTTLDKNSTAVTVAAKSCAEIDFPIRHDTHIRGLVTDTSGNPASNVQISLLHPTQNSLLGFNFVTADNTGADGRYDISKADPGDYWVAINSLGPNSYAPYAPVYYPSGSTQASAQLIHLGALGSSATRDNINLILPPPLMPVTLHIHVVNPDGTPVAHAMVSVSDPPTPNVGQGFPTDAKGNADIALYVGRTYTLVATTFEKREPSCAGPVKFIAKEGLQLGTLTLDKTVSECRAQQKPK